MVESTRNQFKIGRRSLLEVLNAESELFTARSNVESTLQDVKLASWRLYGLQGRIQARTRSLTSMHSVWAALSDIALHYGKRVSARDCRRMRPRCNPTQASP